jgi:hypothetical protein
MLISVEEDQQQDDDRDRDTEKPECEALEHDDSFVADRGALA